MARLHRSDRIALLEILLAVTVLAAGLYGGWRFISRSPRILTFLGFEDPAASPSSPPPAQEPPAPAPTPPEPQRDVIPVLVKAALEDPNEAVRSHAAQALVALGSASVPALLEVVTDRSQPRRLAAMALLASLGAQAQDALEPLAAIFREETEDMTVRHTAFSAILQIGRAGESGLVPLLVEALGMGDKSIQMEALGKLREIGTEAKDALPVLADMLAKEPEDEEVRTLVADAIRAIVGGAGKPDRRRAAAPRQTPCEA